MATGRRGDDQQEGKLPMAQIYSFPNLRQEATGLRLVEPLAKDRRVGPLGGLVIGCLFSLALWAGLFAAFSAGGDGPSAASFTPATVPYVAPVEAFKPTVVVPQPYVPSRPADLPAMCAESCAGGYMFQRF